MKSSRWRRKSATTITLSGAPEVTEGADLVFTLSASVAVTQEVVVSYSFAGTAEGGTGGANDYSNSTVQVTLPSGATSASLTVATNDDSLVESDGETVIVTLTGIVSGPGHLRFPTNGNWGDQ